MKITGIVAEYNPFHIGHQQQLQMIRDHFGKKSGVVVCMSGPFCQRGVPALLDKGVRTELALKIGADLVLELPHIYAASTAEQFAEGAVKTLLATGVVRNLAYGTENPDAHDDIKQLASLLADESEALGQLIRDKVAQGMGFAAAREEAVKDFTHDARQSRLLADSNTILAVEYEKALLRSDPIPTLALPLVEKEKTSATLIRDRVQDAFDSKEKDALWTLMNDLNPSLPPASVASVMDALSQGKGFLTEEMIAPALFLAPVFFDREQLLSIKGMQGGLGERLFNEIRHDPAKVMAEACTRPYDAFARRMATRAHPASRVRRAILAAAMGIRADDPAYMKGPGYIRVLGFTRQGKRLLSYMRHEARLPIVMNASDFRALDDESARRQAELDLQAQAFWNEHAGQRQNSEFERVVRTIR